MTHDEADVPANSSDADQSADTGSGGGGDLGTPSGLPEEQPPSADQEANEAVSGGGMAKPSSEGEAQDTIERPSSGPDTDAE